MTIIKHRDIRGLVGTLCGACIATLVALGFSAAQAQTTPTCLLLMIEPNPTEQNFISFAVASVFQPTNFSCPAPSPTSTFVSSGGVTLFASVDSNNVQTSCELGPFIKQLVGPAPIALPPFGTIESAQFPLDTSTVGTFGYFVIYQDPSFTFESNETPCVDFVVTGPPCTGPVSIAADLASGPGMPFAGTTDQWTVRLRVHACQDITALKAQGGSNGWATNTIPSDPSPNPSVGGATVKQNNKNQVITWIMDDLGQGTAGGTDATLLIDITGSIKPDTTPGTILGLLGPWSLAYSIDGGQTFQKTSPTGAVTVTVEPPL